MWIINFIILSFFFSFSIYKISIIISTYEIYLKGYAQSISLLENDKFVSLIMSMNNDNSIVECESNEFSIVKFIEAPVQNLTKIYCAFMSLLEMTPITESHDYERINTVCYSIKQLVGPSSNASLVCTDYYNELNHELQVQVSSSSTKSNKKQQHTTLSLESIEMSDELSLSEPKKFVTSTVTREANKKMSQRKSTKISSSSSGHSSSSYSIKKLNRKLHRHQQCNQQNNKFSNKQINAQNLPNDFVSQDGKKYYFIWKCFFCFCLCFTITFSFNFFISFLYSIFLIHQLFYFFNLIAKLYIDLFPKFIIKKNKTN